MNAEKPHKRVQLLGGPFDGLIINAFRDRVRIPRQIMGLREKFVQIGDKTIEIYEQCGREGFYRYVSTERDNESENRTKTREDGTI